MVGQNGKHIAETLGSPAIPTLMSLFEPLFDVGPRLVLGEILPWHGIAAAVIVTAPCQFEPEHLAEEAATTVVARHHDGLLRELRKPRIELAGRRRTHRQVDRLRQMAARKLARITRID